jgi:dihydropteroate synthase
MTELVGILNVTPDSFSDGGLYEKPEDALRHADDMFAEGAVLVDVGAESTAPHSPKIGPAEEWRRLEPILPVLLERYPGQISLDTRHPETAERALGIGRVMINDMTCMTNPYMVKAVVDNGACCIIGHIPGNDVHAVHSGKLLDDIYQVRDDLFDREARLLQAGLSPHDIILDPGIGFGKTPELNAGLLSFAEVAPGHQVMIGVSKKRFIHDYFVGEGETRYDIEPNRRAARIAIASGARYLRVHDVAGHRELLD